jgi:hypothetical protein
LGIWSLEFGYCLLFGAWNFFYSGTQLFLDILFDFINVFVGHTIASQVLLSGGSLKDVQEPWGHKSMTMTLRNFLDRLT